MSASCTAAENCFSPRRALARPMTRPARHCAASRAASPRSPRSEPSASALFAAATACCQSRAASARCTSRCSAPYSSACTGAAACGGHRRTRHSRHTTSTLCSERACWARCRRARDGPLAARRTRPAAGEEGARAAKSGTLSTAKAAAERARRPCARAGGSTRPGPTPETGCVGTRRCSRTF